MEIFIFSIISVGLGLVMGIILAKKTAPKVEKSESFLRLEAENNSISTQLIELKNERSNLQTSNNQLIAENSSLSERNSQLNINQERQKNEIEQMNVRFQNEFELLANKILTKNTKDFSETHQLKLAEILNPLQTKIKNFEDSIEKKYIDDTKERAGLKQELKQLLLLNETLRDEANNLTSALKGESKTQGNWGELVLERILENSGLQKGEEYDTQFSGKNEEGKRLQPDIIINLPENKHLVIDSKVSLTAYERFSSSDDIIEKATQLKAHIVSIKSHIKLLSEKHYQNINHLNTPDFVMLFIPIESSFGIAVREDKALFQYAWDKKIVIVSPSTLLATLRTIASVWKYEKQNNNALEIAKKAGQLYDKFVGFLDDLEKLGRNMDQSKSNYDQLMNKISLGNGNLVKRTQELKKLGIKPTKDIPKNFLEPNED
jgi:DNA recombination protein RmuC